MIYLGLARIVAGDWIHAPNTRKQFLLLASAQGFTYVTERLIESPTFQERRSVDEHVAAIQRPP
jgi:hypothetical protein